MFQCLVVTAEVDIFDARISVNDLSDGLKTIDCGGPVLTVIY